MQKKSSRKRESPKGRADRNALLRKLMRDLPKDQRRQFVDIVRALYKNISDARRMAVLSFVVMVALGWWVYRAGERDDATLTEDERNQRRWDNQW